MEKGEMVDSELVVDLLIKTIDGNQASVIVIEGFPKNQSY
jgi:hypothetical protein